MQKKNTNIHNVTEIDFHCSNEGPRKDLKERVENQFRKEIPGTESNSGVSKYKYNVESIKAGNRIFLERPAMLYNGNDFRISVENMEFPGNRKQNIHCPKHEHIAKDLQAKKEENPEMYIKLYKIIKDVYECHEIDEQALEALEFHSGYPVDMVVKVLKWMFIEQDIRYWLYLGRAKTWTIVPTP